MAAKAATVTILVFSREASRWRGGSKKPLLNRASVSIWNPVTSIPTWLRAGGWPVWAATRKPSRRSGRRVALAPGEPLSQAQLGWALGLAAQRQEALTILRDLEQRRNVSYVSGYLLACICVATTSTIKPSHGWSTPPKTATVS